jgi:hypothetical protein
LNIKPHRGHAFDILKPEGLEAKAPAAKEYSKPLPSIVGEIVIPEKASESQLAALLGQKPFHIIADLMEIAGLERFARKPINTRNSFTEALPPLTRK